MIVKFTADELDLIRDAAGVIGISSRWARSPHTLEAFVKHAAIKTAEDLVASSTAEDRHGAIPRFIHDRLDHA